MYNCSCFLTRCTSSSRECTWCWEGKETALLSRILRRRSTEHLSSRRLSLLPSPPIRTSASPSSRSSPIHLPRVSVTPTAILTTRHTGWDHRMGCQACLQYLGECRGWTRSPDLVRDSRQSPTTTWWWQQRRRRGWWWCLDTRVQLQHLLHHVLHIWYLLRVFLPHCLYHQNSWPDIPQSRLVWVSTTQLYWLLPSEAPAHHLLHHWTPHCHHQDHQSWHLHEDPITGSPPTSFLAVETDILL